MPTLDPPVSRPRPKHLNLVKIKQPLAAIVSILHRVSGAAMFLFGIPLLLLLVNASLASSESYASVKEVIGSPLVKLILLGFVWAYLHHFCAGIRFLLLDIHWGVGLVAARTSSRAVLVVSLVLTVMLGVRLW
ncbi:succinate dehydrogenase / fumarate reductase, cytochrome b subunit [Burkholderiales bacterium]|nr:MAG: succinate dehydrogenase, cytochrome b556 subunit [Burkholderiales bacterium]CAG0995360.1 succinate dehydrogenase / fumarate reductase, cytochrome b subunit [Burkholderiales bacterium]